MSLYTKNNHDTQYLPNKCYLLLPFQLKPERQAKRKKEGRNAKQRATFVNPKWNQSWIFMEGLMLKLQYFGHLMQRTDSLGKTLMLGKYRGREEKGTTEDTVVGWYHRLKGCEVWANSGIEWRTGKPGILQFTSGSKVSIFHTRSQRVGRESAAEQQWQLSL